MRILFYIHSLSCGGAERVTTTLANYWAGRGWSVIIVTATGREQDFYTMDHRVKRIPLSLDSTSDSLWQGFWNNLHRVTKLRGLLKKYRPDVAVAMMPTANVTLALAARGLGIATIGAERTYPPAMPLGRVWERMRQWSYPFLTVVTVQTRHARDWLRENTSTRRITVICNPIEYPLLFSSTGPEPETTRRIIGATRLLLAVGRLGEEKQFCRTLTAFSELTSRHPDWGLIILGEGTLRQELEAKAAALGISSRTQLPGSVRNIGNWYKAADLYVLTSRFEGFPNTLLEAMAHGLPVVAVDCKTGPREILRHGVDGFLVPQDNLPALQESLDTLMGDSELRGRFGARAEDVRQRYSVEKIAGQWEDLFETIMTSNDVSVPS